MNELIFALGVNRDQRWGRSIFGTMESRILPSHRIGYRQIAVWSVSQPCGNAMQLPGTAAVLCRWGLGGFLWKWSIPIETWCRMNSVINIPSASYCSHIVLSIHCTRTNLFMDKGLLVRGCWYSIITFQYSCIIPSIVEYWCSHNRLSAPQNRLAPFMSVFEFHQFDWLRAFHHHNTFTTFPSIAAHYSDVIMRPMGSQITGVQVICSTVCLDADQRKPQSSV